VCRPGRPAEPLLRLARTTHVHLLGFAIRYGDTSRLFSLTGTANKVGVIDPLLGAREEHRVLE